MSALLDAFWRAAAYCLHPRVIGLSLLPLVIAAALSVGLGYLYWEAAVAGVRATLEAWSWVAMLLAWLDTVGAAGLGAALAPLVILAVAVPVIVVLSLLLVALLMTPAIVNLVTTRRFAALERRHGATMWQGALWSLGCALWALLLLVISIPLWFVPPLVLIVPPLIWGWLTYRVMSFDVLADHASAEERRQIMREHRWPLLGIGIIAGYLGAAPSMLWAVSAMLLVFAPLLIVITIWLYTLVFAFSALWFAHYALAALQRLRRDRQPVSPIDAAGVPPSLEAPASRSGALPSL
jgi:Etoposide-induced protein 2.4 (EI24)